MKRLLITSVLSLIWTLGIAVIDANAQTAYGISIVRYNNSTRIVDGYSGTWLDYYAGLYYDPEVIGDLYRTDMNETSLDFGRSIGYADIIPAEVYLRTTNFVEGRTYCTFSQHAVWGYFYYQQTGLWFDPFRYSTYFGAPPSPWPGFPFGYYYAIPRRYFLGTTQACITIPVTPPTTPTPTPPPPTPTPTPCTDAAALCPGYTVGIYVNPTTVRPTGVSGGGNTANVSVCITPALANRSASIQLVRRPQYVNTGGHIESLHTGLRPLGKLKNMSGVTGSDGCFRTSYSPSHIGGFVGINGSALGTTVGGDILVDVPLLPRLSDGENYNLIGETPSHPDNHNGTLAANTGLGQIADDYRSEYYGGNPMPESAKLHYNDMSVTWGGKFDLAKSWSNAGAHAEHREGINTDVRCCTDPGNIPRERWVRLNEFFRNRGSTDTNDETRTAAPHWHLRFEFGTPRVAERTPHSFVEDVFDASLQRSSTQTEYESWLDRIMNAKAQGQNELLLEAKTFEKEQFASSEYAARHRTDSEFISDVYWAHVFREPTEMETGQWLNYLQNQPPSVPPSRRRARLIDEFQLTTEFQDVVFGMVDATVPTQ